MRRSSGLHPPGFVRLPVRTVAASVGTEIHGRDTSVTVTHRATGSDTHAQHTLCFALLHSVFCFKFHRIQSTQTSSSLPTTTQGEGGGGGMQHEHTLRLPLAVPSSYLNRNASGSYYRDGSKQGCAVADVQAVWCPSPSLTCRWGLRRRPDKPYSRVFSRSLPVSTSIACSASARAVLYPRLRVGLCQWVCHRG